MFGLTLRWPVAAANPPTAEPAAAPAAPARLGVAAHELTATIGAALDRGQDHGFAWIAHLRSAIGNLEPLLETENEDTLARMRVRERLAEMRRELAVHVAAHGEPT